MWNDFIFIIRNRGDDGAQEMEYTGDDYYTAAGAYYYVEAAPDQQ